MDYDFVVIGGGSAGYAAARTASGLSLRTALVEGGERIGGLCILQGCMPSKALIESANRLLALRRARDFGLRARDLEAHADEIVARQRQLIGEFADERREQIEHGAFEFIRGRAEFLDAHTLRVAWPGQQVRSIRSRCLLIATGSSVYFPPVPGLADCQPLTSNEALELESPPASLAVLGGGPVALELAHYFAALGVNVTVIQRGPQLLSGSDPDLAQVVEESLTRRGISIFTETAIGSLEPAAGGTQITFDHGGTHHAITCERVLNALGRRPALAGLGLAEAGVAHPHGRVEANAHQQTSQPHIFAAGDCCGPHEVVHLAVQQGEIAGRNAHRMLAGDPDLESIDYRLKLFAVFTEPQVATVGCNEAEAREGARAIRVAKHPFADHGKSLIMGETDGFVKLIADAATGVILGGSVVGPHASDLIHEIVVAMRFHATAAQVAAIPHYHPTLSEIWTYPAEELASPEGTC